MDHPSELIGRFVGLLLLAIPALYFLRQVFQPAPASRRLANLALLCGLTALIVPELALGPLLGSQPTLLFVSGIARLFLAVVGIALAALAFTRRRDGGVGVGRPTVAGAS